MSLTSAQRLDRLKVRLAELQFWRARETVPVAGWRFEGAPIALGAPWPKSDGVVHFTASLEVPAHWALEESRLSVNVGGESLLTLSDAGGETVSFGLDPYHEEFPLHGRRLALATDSVRAAAVRRAGPRAAPQPRRAALARSRRR